LSGRATFRGRLGSRFSPLAHDIPNFVQCRGLDHGGGHEGLADIASSLFTSNLAILVAVFAITLCCFPFDHREWEWPVALSSS
jgi:hypothetical protein